MTLQNLKHKKSVSLSKTNSCRMNPQIITTILRRRIRASSPYPHTSCLARIMHTIINNSHNYSHTIRSIKENLLIELRSSCTILTHTLKALFPVGTLQPNHMSSAARVSSTRHMHYISGFSSPPSGQTRNTQRSSTNQPTVSLLNQSLS